MAVPCDLRWVDTHCHLDAPEFDADRAEVAQRARDSGVAMQVLPAVKAAHFEALAALAQREGLAYALGIHPLYVAESSDDDLDRLAQALRERRDDPRLVAVGEIGLDFAVPNIDIDRQQRFYQAQLKLAREAGLPVLLHVRRSADALLAQLRRLPVAGGIAHAFNGSRVQAEQFAALGFALGFGGALTFDRALQIRRLAAELPASMLVLETDAPDIPPHWLYRTAGERAADGRGHHRNEPAELPRIARELAGLRGIPEPELAACTTRNALRVLPRLQRFLGASGVSGTG